jgi:hypothetical protein
MEQIMLKRFVIEREIKDVGALSPEQAGEAARTSNVALAKLSGIQWDHSYVADNKTFCVYLAESESLIREHARMSGFPASKITEIKGMLDPTSERQCALARTAA